MDRLREIDPPPRRRCQPTAPGGSPQLSPAQIRKMIEDAQKKQKSGGDPHGGAALTRSALARRALAVVARRGGVSGCGLADVFTGDRVNPEVPSWYHRPSGSMNVFVHRTLTAPSRAVGEDWERGKPEIDAAHDRVFVGSSDHGLYALRAGDGSTLWRFETLNVVQSEPLYDPEMDYVYFGSNDGALYCVQRRDREARLPLRHRRRGLEEAGSLRGEPLLLERLGLPLLDRSPHRQAALAGASHAGARHGDQRPLRRRATIRRRTSCSWRSRTATSSRTTPATAPRSGRRSICPPRPSSPPARLRATSTPTRRPSSTTTRRGASSTCRATRAASTRSMPRTGARVWSNDKAIGVTDSCSGARRAHRPNPNGPDKDGPIVPERKLLIASSATYGLTGLDPYTGRVVWRNKVPEGGITAPVPVAGAHPRRHDPLRAVPAVAAQRQASSTGSTSAPASRRRPRPTAAART